jgi:hypothetical protein
MSVELTIKGDVERLHLGPDDVVVVTLQGVHTSERFQEVAEIVGKAMDRLGLKDRFLVLTAETALISVIEKPA